MTNRKLASIQTIAEIRPIENSDNLAHYRINGWWVVDKKDSYSLGDKVTYLEVDSWVPYELAPFLSKGKEPHEFNGVKGERLRTIKLRGALSQGLLLPLTVEGNIGDDLTEHLGIQKWEKPTPTQLAGQMRGNFPSFIRKTDQERVQNLDISQYIGLTFEVSEKLDGSSMTIYQYQGDWGVCSRNIDLKLDQEGNSFVEMFKQLQPRLNSIQQNLALQGELIGGKIQGNPYNLPHLKFYLFSVYDIDNQQYLLPHDAKSLAEQLNVSYVPIVTTYTITETTTTENLLALAENKSALNPKTEREGLVFKSTSTPASFKVISNRWLLKTGE